ncbi:hypothetical protein ACFL0L_00125 [Patescibacteria group bacterium]
MANRETGGDIPEEEKKKNKSAGIENDPTTTGHGETVGDIDTTQSVASSESGGAVPVVEKKKESGGAAGEPDDKVVDFLALRKEGLDAGAEDHEKAIPPTEAENRAADSTLDAEMSPERQESMIGDIHEGVNRYAEDQRARAADAETEADPLNRAKEFFGRYKNEFDEAVREVNKLLDNDQQEEASKLARSFIEQMKAKAGKYFGDKIDGWFQEYDDLTDQADGESKSTKKERLMKLAMEGVDFIPVVGPMKMLAESAAGKTLSGQKLTKFKRMFHAMEGATFLALDLTGIGAVAKGAKASKLITRSSALMRKLGVARKAYIPIFKFGKFIARHPALAKVADKVIKYTILRRKKRKTAFVKSIPGVVLSDQEARRMAA